MVDVTLTWLVRFDSSDLPPDDLRSFAHLFPNHVLDAPFLGTEVALCGTPVLNLRPGLVFQRAFPADPVCPDCQTRYVDVP